MRREQCAHVAVLGGSGGRRCDGGGGDGGGDRGSRLGGDGGRTVWWQPRGAAAPTHTARTRTASETGVRGVVGVAAALTRLHCAATATAAATAAAHLRSSFGCIAEPSGPRQVPSRVPPPCTSIERARGRKRGRIRAVHLTDCTQSEISK